MSLESDSQHRFIGAGQAVDAAGDVRWWFVLVDLAATGTTAGEVVLNVSARAPVDDPRGWCGDSFWLTRAEAGALAAAIRRAAAHGDAMSVAELHAPGAAGETTWLRVHARRRQVVLELVIADPTLIISFDPEQAAVLAEALDRASES